MAFDAFIPKITLPANKTDIRKGDGIAMICNGKVMVVDSFQGGEPTDGIISWLKSNNVTQVDLAVATHAHGDHIGGFDDIANAGIKIKEFRCYHINSIRDGNDASREDSDNLLAKIRWLQKRGTRVLFVDHGDVLKFEDTSWHIFRKQPEGPAASDDPNAWEYVNNGSLVLHSPELEGMLPGDGPENPKEAIAYFQRKYGKVKILTWFDISHHGGAFSQSNAESAKNAGAKIAYESCVEDGGPGTTDWTKYGARRVVQQDIPVLMQDQNIYIHAAAGKLTFKQGSKSFTFDVPYQEEEKEGWVKNTVGWWYRYKDGSWPADCMVELPWSQGIDTFCFDSRGYMVTGWRKIEGKWYYFDENGAMVTGWRKINGKWYYLSRGESGAMVTGWQKLDGKMYYFDASGAMVTDWQKIGDKWYYFSAGGAMQTGWIVWKDAWFYLDTEDGHMHIGWLDYKSKRCYLDGSGRALCDCIRVIDGKTYQFDKDCYATELSAEASPVIPGTKVIDVSEFQPEDIEWHKLKAAGYAVIVRMGLRGSIKGTSRYRKVGYDYHFKKYIAGVIAAGIPYSVYYFPTPLSDAEADEEADWIVMNTDGLNMSMPLWLDSERVDKGVANDISTADRTRYLKRISDKLVAAGIPCGIYASTSWLNNQINMGQIQQQVQENTWCAQYADACTYNGVYAMWQYSSKARVPGIDDEVDISVVKRQFNTSCKKSAAKENAMTKDNVKIFPVTNPVKISNSGSDENGNYKGGAAGDNTGREWQIRDWYNRPWNCVLRHPDPEVRACIADLATKAANNNKIGYDQYQRDTYWKELQKAGYDPSKITTACESDCSAGVIANIKAAGYILGKPELQNITCTYTGNMRAGLKAAGFACLTDSKYLTSSAYLVAGDVLLNDKHHTATAVTNGISSGNGDITASAMPLIKRGSKGAAVLQLQKLLNKLGYGLEEDSSFGPATDAAVRAYQKMSHLEVDGEVGPMTWAALIEGSK